MGTISNACLKRQPGQTKKALTVMVSALGKMMVGRAGFEPAYSMRADLQSAAFNHSATYPVSLARGGMFVFPPGC